MNASARTGPNIESARTTKRPRLAILSGFMPYYEAHLPAGERQRLHEWCAGVAARFSDLADIDFPGLIDSEERGFAVGRDLGARGVEAFLIVNPFPAPAGFIWEVLRQAPKTPVVVWAAYKTRGIDGGYDSIQHLLSSGNVGVAMIGNLLARSGRHPKVVAGNVEDAGALARARNAVKVALAAGRLGKARLAICGKPLPGYANVTCDPAALATEVGPRMIDISVEEFTDAFLSASPDRVDTIVAACNRYRVEDGAAAELAESARLAVALETICARHDCHAGAYSSHGEYGNLNPKIGLMGAFATSWMTGKGVPFTDTADVITAIAMLAGKLLSDSAQYTELNTIDPDAGAILCANTGEADFASARSDQDVLLLRTGSITGKKQRGVSVDFTMRAGPACMIGFSPVADGWRLIAMDGECLGAAPAGLKVPKHWFKPERPCDDAFASWIEAGATHHAALCLNAKAADAAALARHLRIGATIV